MGGAGPGDVDGTVEEALPLEQSLRSLTHWWNVRHYPEQMGVEEKGLVDGEQDFFEREIERMEALGVGLGTGMDGDEEGGEDWGGVVEGY